MEKIIAQLETLAAVLRALPGNHPPLWVTQDGDEDLTCGWTCEGRGVAPSVELSARPDGNVSIVWRSDWIESPQKAAAIIQWLLAASNEGE